MKKLGMIFILSIFFISFAFAETTVEYYYGLDCSHCKVVADSGVLDRISTNVPVAKYETWYNVQNQNKFSALLDELNVPDNQRGVPFLFINCSGKVTYLIGDTPIINNAENYVSTCNFDSVPTESSSKLWIWVLVIVAVLAAAYLFFRKKN